MQYNISSIMLVLLLGTLRARGQCSAICGTYQSPCSRCVGSGQRCGITKSQVANIYFCVPCCNQLECIPEAPGAAWGYCSNARNWRDKLKRPKDEVGEQNQDFELDFGLDTGVGGNKKKLSRQETFFRTELQDHVIWLPFWKPNESKHSRRPPGTSGFQWDRALSLGVLMRSGVVKQARPDHVIFPTSAQTNKLRHGQLAVLAAVPPAGRQLVGALPQTPG
ncbi:hypothetical protein DFH09DRAFT_1076697 [Mycena vulgaris]|nr:hypothetical protein DFH09DRAFT_1076697 [Mycena vulgaris]